MASLLGGAYAPPNSSFRIYGFQTTVKMPLNYYAPIDNVNNTWLVNFNFYDFNTNDEAISYDNNLFVGIRKMKKVMMTFVFMNSNQNSPVFLM